MYDTLVLSGGGIKGIAHLGALEYYTNEIPSIREFIGTSIGSVICLLLVCGYKPIEIFQTVYIDDNFFGSLDIKNISEIMKNYGLMTMKIFLERIEDMVQNKLGFIPNLRELHLLSGKILRIVTVNETKSRVEYMDYNSKPEISCVEAVGLSCSLPFIFFRSSYEGCYYADGGLADNFAINSSTIKNSKILGIVLTSSSGPPPTEGFIYYVYRLLNIPILCLSEMSLKIASMIHPSPDIVSVCCDDSVLSLKIPSSQKMDLFLKGKKYAKVHNYVLKLFIPLEDDDWDLSAFQTLKTDR